MKTGYGVFALVATFVIATDAFKLFGKHLEQKRGKGNSKYKGGNEVTLSPIEITSDLPKVVEAPLYGTVELNCGATSSPVPTIHWLLNGSRIYHEYEKLTDDEAVYENTRHNRQRPLINRGKTEAKLVLDCLTPEDQGVYSCVAQTPMGKEVKSTRLVIAKGEVADDKCLMKKQSVEEGEAPVIYMHTKTRAERNDADVQLFCRASGFPKPIVTWRKSSGERILKDQRKKYKLLPNGDLLIRSVSHHDMGDYICEAANIFGEDKQNTFFMAFNN